ncbi:DNA-binding response regulator, NarL/FixJ family, contains REC and HTH domains [Actinobaculum suis]|uniref:DNA-binding response regulator, NarL/FixJ family, contains REC and HTH domains n=1 Tax=Actinobaculum suis TaxID=1657 RepID=A0A0K9ETF8_9ACTO|nr:response regulator transcription factor [Actinobaculum suis]KMY23453.1 transcriptional regulator [Actinobaculum suis]MDY5154074.1 response regulator transcription factor [Actinobaculum suis]OCA95731.1 two-component system response regulator [Actinobaculum suis]OCA95951.1 two-component system response regulator [Actinobaculum suis]SDE50962.1 DNA-binding response regulator, NarL/FixJ family, contains REC and HTH domains [Actinobaculum suis]
MNVEAKQEKITLKIAIADDDHIMREGLQRLLAHEEGIEIAWVAQDGAEALRLLCTQSVDVLLLDVDMPIKDGVETAREVSFQYPNIAIIMLTAFHQEESLAQSIGAGVRGFLTKDVLIPDLVQAIRKAYKGEKIMSARPTEILAEAYFQSHVSQGKYADFIAAVQSLPARLQPTFNLLLEAATNKTIARRLNLKETTVRSYVSDILAHMSCNTRVELVVTALKAGLHK